MGYGGAIPEESVLDIIERTLADLEPLCIPQYLYVIYPGKRKDLMQIEVADRLFRTGKMISFYLEEVEQVCVFVATAGKEYDQYKREARERGDLMTEFVADAIGSVIAEACVERVSGELDSHYPETVHTYPYSPGYCGWKLREQAILFSLLPEAPCGITLTDSCLMWPIKTISGIIGLGKNIQRRAYGCTICENVNCYKRKESRV